MTSERIARLAERRPMFDQLIREVCGSCGLTYAWSHLLLPTDEDRIAQRQTVRALFRDHKRTCSDPLGWWKN
jgi:hypothetical protein